MGDPSSSRIGGFDDHATALGYLCFRYASMEADFNRLLGLLLRAPTDATRAVIDATGSSLATRLLLMKKLAALQCPDQHWYDALENVADCAGKNILPHRNRLIHDEWFANEKEFGQSDVRTYLKQAEAGAPKSITPPVQLERTLESIWQLTDDCMQASIDATFLRMDFDQWLRTKQYRRIFEQFRAASTPHYRTPPPPTPKQGKQKQPPPSAE